MIIIGDKMVLNEIGPDYDIKMNRADISSKCTIYGNSIIEGGHVIDLKSMPKNRAVVAHHILTTMKEGYGDDDAEIFDEPMTLLGHIGYAVTNYNEANPEEMIKTPSLNDVLSVFPDAIINQLK